MSTNTSSANYGRFDELADEFAARFRRGERPSLQEYIGRCPDLADEIRELFPALVEVELAEDDHPSRPVAAEAAVARPPLGQVGDYRVLREVGRGGMGVVYEAEQVSLGRRVALKVLPRQVSQDLQTLARFRREARSAAQLHHTNIVPVFEVGKDGDVSYYAMQFIQGQGLDLVITELRRLKNQARATGPAKEPKQPDVPIPPGPTAAAPSPAPQVSRMAQSLLTGRFAPEPPDGPGEADAASANREATAALTERLDPDETDAPPASDLAPVAAPSPPSSVVLPGGSQLSAVEAGRRSFFRSAAHIGRQVAAGLTYAHARGIVHRDIKPSNLILDTEGVVWITDFGLAKAGDDGLTQTGDILGTVRYMAPERFRGEGDARADVYALGLTLYELLTLRPAFDSSDRLRLIEQIKTEEPPRPRALDTRIPRDLETIVLKAIDKDPKGRYQSAEEVTEDLRRFLADEPIRARRVSTAERVWRWCKRNPVVAGLTAAVFVLLAVVAGVASIAYVREAAKRAVAEAAEVKAKEEAQRAQEAEQEMRRQWYAASINLMQSAWDTGQVGRLHALLAETEAYPDRGFEWYYCQRLGHLEQQTFIGHLAVVLSVSWSPDGTRLATGSEDGTAKLWGAASGRELLTFKDPTGPAMSADIWSFWSPSAVWSVAWSPDGKFLATGSYDGTVKVWDAAGRRKPLLAGRHASGVHSVSWSPDGTRLATGSWDSTARVWDATARQELLTLKGQTSLVGSVSWSPDGKWLATGSDYGTAMVWDAASGREQLTLRGHTVPVISLHWSPGLVSPVAWSPDGKQLATGNEDGTAKVWNAAGGRELLTLSRHTAWVRSVSWSPDGTQLATGSADGTAKLWDAAGGREPLTLKRPATGVASVSWSPSGVWSTSGIYSVSWSPDGKFLATGSNDGTVKVWDAAGGREPLTVGRHANAVLSVSWSPDGTRLAAGIVDGTAKVWDATGGRESLTLKGHTSGIWSVCWSPDGTRLATASSDRTAQVWQASGGRKSLTLKGHTNGVWSVCWSPDGTRLATGSSDGTAKVWDAAGGRELLTLKGHTGYVYSVCWSPDGARLATGSSDGTAKVWDAAGGRELLTLKGHTGYVWSVSWSPDGKRLATGSVDGTAKVWDAAGAEAVQEWVRQDRAVQDLLARNAFRGPHARGFIQTWLLLLPLPFAPGETGAQALDRQQVPAEAQLRPRLGDRVLVGGRGLVWREYRSPEAAVSFNAVLGRVAERSVAYAVCYLESDQPRDGLWLQVGGDDRAAVYLNGRQIYQSRLGRPLSLDTAGPVALKQGSNVLLFKVVNVGGGWEGCARVLDDAGLPANGIRVKLTP